MGHKHDYVERWRRYWYPKLDHVLKGAGITSTGVVTPTQYVATLRADVDAVERVLLHGIFERNPLAYLKKTRDGRMSAGSWVLTNDRAREVGTNPWTALDLQYEADIEATDRQLHFTLVPTAVEVDGRVEHCVDLYAHEEYDWRKRPLAHLREKYLYPHVGVEMALWFLDQHDVLERGTDYIDRQR